MLAELRIEPPFVLAGRSFGALLAAEYAKAHPAALSKLVLIGLQERYELKQEYKLLLSLPDRLLQAIAATPSASLAVVKNVYVNSLRGLDVKSAIAGLRPSRRIQSAAPELFFTE
jgi:pimeloyl-ACP methyl ester carboxylesterase